MLELSVTFRARRRRVSLDGELSAPLVEVLIEGEASFFVDTRNLRGKLGTKLETLLQQAGLEESGTMTNCHIAPAPEDIWSGNRITVCAPGTASGISSERERTARNEERLKLRRANENISLEDLGL